MSDVMVLRKITQFDIEEGRSFLKKAGTFRGSSVLDNPYLTDICIRLTGTDDDKRSTLQDISDWLREQEKNGDVKCYVSTVTLGEFKEEWFTPLRNKAIDVIDGEDVDQIRLAGIEFKRSVLDRNGDIKRRTEEVTKLQAYAANVPSVPKAPVASDGEVDPRQELIDHLIYCKNRRDENDGRNQSLWIQEIRKASESLYKMSSETQKNPQLHMEMFQHELAIYLESNTITLQEMYPDFDEKLYMKTFEENYTKIALLRGSIFIDQD